MIATRGKCKNCNENTEFILVRHFIRIGNSLYHLCICPICGGILAYDGIFHKIAIENENDEDEDNYHKYLDKTHAY